MRTWIVKNRNIDFSVKCKQSYLMELFYNTYPNEERVNNFYKFKQKYRVFSMTDKELERGVQYKEISN